jgi:hypothetical protein
MTTRKRSVCQQRRLESGHNFYQEPKAAILNSNKWYKIAEDARDELCSAHRDLKTKTLLNCPHSARRPSMVGVTFFMVPVLAFDIATYRQAHRVALLKNLLENNIGHLRL